MIGSSAWIPYYSTYVLTLRRNYDKDIACNHCFVQYQVRYVKVKAMAIHFASLLKDKLGTECS